MYYKVSDCKTKELYEGTVYKAINHHLLQIIHKSRSFFSREFWIIYSTATTRFKVLKMKL